MLSPVVPLRFSNSFITITKSSYPLYKNGLFQKLERASNMALLALYFYQKILKHILNKTNRCIFQKSGTVITQNSPSGSLLLIRWKVLVIFRVNELEPFLGSPRGKNIIQIFKNFIVYTFQESMTWCPNWQLLPKIQVFNRPE